MYCTNCGAWNPDESKYCGKCGQRLEAKDQKGRIIPAGLLVGLAALLVVAITVVASVFLARDRLLRTWASFFAQPTEIAVLPTATMTQIPITPTATPTLEPTPTATPTVLATPSPAATATMAATPTPKGRTFKLVYLDCIPHGLSLGAVKGQVFDKAGNVIPGAKVRITINGYEWKSDANPATTNGAGWYEWILEVGQDVEFVELIVDGRSVPFTPADFVVEARASCFQRVDFVEQ
jgi:hypothetical protein